MMFRSLCRATTLAVFMATLLMPTRSPANDLLPEDREEIIAETLSYLSPSSKKSPSQLHAFGKGLERRGPKSEIKRMVVRESWRRLILAERRANCLRNDLLWRDEAAETKHIVTTTEMETRFLQRKREFGNVTQLGLDDSWFDPSGATGRAAWELCKLMLLDLAKQDEAADFSVLKQLGLEIFRQRQPGETTNGQMVGEAAAGFWDGAKGIPTIPENIWTGIRERWGTLEQLRAGDPDAELALYELWRERADTAKLWIDRPSEQVARLGEAMLKLSPRQIGTITFGIEVGILTDRSGRFVWNNMQSGEIVGTIRKLQRTIRDSPDAQEVEDLRAQVKSLKEQNDVLRRVAQTDPLSQVYNRRALEEDIGRDLLKTASAEKPLSVLYLDGDYFSAFNDLVRHSAGDDMIRVYAKEIRDVLTSLRQSDFIFRMGGEEFLVVLPETALAQAEEVAHRIRAAIKLSKERLMYVQAVKRAVDEGHPKVGKVFHGKPFPGEDNMLVSVGVTEHVPGEELAATISRADQALHIAKLSSNGTAERVGVAVVQVPKAPAP